jgi:6-phosphogluconolactonase
LREEVVADAEAAALRGAELIANAAGAAIEASGSFSLAVSGGHAPWRMFELLGTHELDWDSIDIFQVDERIAATGDPDRNLTHLLESLPPDGAARVRPMPVNDDDDLDAAAARYAEELPAALDLVHLGLGPDGHTASLFPKSPALEERERLVVATGDDLHPHPRLTLTFPALAQSRLAVFTVAGEGKREALERVKAGDDLPAARVSAGRVIWLVDEAANG